MIYINEFCLPINGFGIGLAVVNHNDFALIINLVVMIINLAIVCVRMKEVK